MKLSEYFFAADLKTEMVDGEMATSVNPDDPPFCLEIIEVAAPREFNHEHRCFLPEGHEGPHHCHQCDMIPEEKMSYLAIGEGFVPTWLRCTECLAGRHEAKEIAGAELRSFERICRHCKVIYSEV